jgi:hypothetical protein
LNSNIPIFPSRLHLPKTKSFMAFRLSPVQLLVRRHPQASPKLKPLPTFETSLNHGDYSRLPPSSHLESQCLAVQGCPYKNLQGWYRLHRRHRPARLQLAHRGVHRPDNQALRFYHLILSKHLSKLHPDASTSPAPLLQGWGFHLKCHRLSLRGVSLHESPLLIAPAPGHRHRPHLRSSPLEDHSTSVSLTRCPRPKPLGPLLNQLALQASAGPCQLQRYRDLLVSAKHCPN